MCAECDPALAAGIVNAVCNRDLSDIHSLNKFVGKVIATHARKHMRPGENGTRPVHVPAGAAYLDPGPPPPRSKDRAQGNIDDLSRKVRVWC